MSEILYAIVRIVAKVHNYIMHLNDKFELYFSDKEMHFIIIGLLGMGMLFIIYPLFKWLAENKHVMVIAWIYVFTLIIVITFAIEIGQKISSTGNMEFGDIMFGVIGFIAMFLVFSVCRALYHLLMMFIKSKLEPKKSEESGVRAENANVYEDVKKDRVTEQGEPLKLQEVKVIELNTAQDIDTNLIAQAYEEQLTNEQVVESDEESANVQDDNIEHTKVIR